MYNSFTSIHLSMYIEYLMHNNGVINILPTILINVKLEGILASSSKLHCRKRSITKMKIVKSKIILLIIKNIASFLSLTGSLVFLFKFKAIKKLTCQKTSFTQTYIWDFLWLIFRKVTDIEIEDFHTCNWSGVDLKFRYKIRVLSCIIELFEIYQLIIV